MQCSTERVEDEADIFQGNDPQQGVITGLSQDHGAVAFAGIQGNMAFGNGAFNLRSVGQSKNDCALRGEANLLPYIDRKECVSCAAIDKKI